MEKNPKEKREASLTYPRMADLRKVIIDMIDSASCEEDENAWEEHLETLEALIKSSRYAWEESFDPVDGKDWVMDWTKEQFKVFIPSQDEENGWSIPEGNYGCNGIVRLLRTYKKNPDAIEFIADMMEH